MVNQRFVRQIERGKIKWFRVATLIQTLYASDFSLFLSFLQIQLQMIQDGAINVLNEFHHR